MFEFKWHISFEKSFKKLTKKNDFLKDRIIITLKILENDPYDSSLKSHKLHGDLKKMMSCHIDNEYRIVFALSEDIENTIILIYIGTGMEVF